MCRFIDRFKSWWLHWTGAIIVTPPTPSDPDPDRQHLLRKQSETEARLRALLAERAVWERNHRER